METCQPVLGREAVKVDGEKVDDIIGVRVIYFE
jgi:hypothetical protein